MTVIFCPCYHRDGNRRLLSPTGAVRSVLQSVTDEIYEGFMDDPIVDIPSDSFDVVCLFDVLEHFRDVKMAMTNLARCLKSGGIVLLETGNIACLPARIFKSLWWYYDYIEHLVFFDPKSLEGCLRLNQLQLIVCKQVIHTYSGNRFRMVLDLMAKMVQAWKQTFFLSDSNVHEKIYVGHPFRVYWPDHIFGVAIKQ
jgi:SAM-dependent methyltransferase